MFVFILISVKIMKRIKERPAERITKTENREIRKGGGGVCIYAYQCESNEQCERKTDGLKEVKMNRELRRERERGRGDSVFQYMCL